MAEGMFDLQPLPWVGLVPYDSLLTKLWCALCKLFLLSILFKLLLLSSRLLGVLYIIAHMFYDIYYYAYQLYT